MAASASALPPIPRTRLIGRAAERSVARTRLLDDAVPVLTLTGPGGVGKTRLALAVAGDVADGFADGVVWVDLAALADPALVPTAMATAVGVTPTPGQPIVDELIRILRPRQTLLLLDNCEHLLAATAALVAVLLGACPALQVLATSRAPLRVRGEHEAPVDPLPVPPTGVVHDPVVVANSEAVRLFLERALAVRPTLPVDATTVPAIAAICCGLDGLPLAIELAAARVRLLSPEALLAQMHDRLRLLRGGARDLPARQQTMRDAIAWSYELLTPEEQTVFRATGIFVGGFDGTSAAAVVGEDAPTVADRLEALLDQNLVRRAERVEGGVRFDMLETIRAFALERLVESGEHDAVAARHAAHYIDLAERAEAPLWDSSLPIVDLLPRLETEHANIRAALTWLPATDPGAHVRLAGALGPFWYYHGHLVEGRRWLAGALAIAADLGDALPAVDRARVQISLGLILQMQGDLEGATTSLEQGLARAVDAGEVWRAAIARTLLGGVLVTAGRYEEAEPLYAEAEAQWRALDRPLWVGIVLFHLGLIAHARRDPDRAVQLFTDAARLEDAHGGELEAVDPLHHLALIACERRDVAGAARLMADVLGRLRRRGSDPALAVGVADVATLAAYLGDAAVAARLFGAAAGLLETGGGTYSPLTREAYERAEQEARRDLIETDWQAAVAAGRGLPLDRVLVEAEVVLAAAGGGDGSVRTHGTTGDRGRSGPSPRQGPSGGTHAGPRALELTRREREVLALLCERLTDREIADRLYIASRTASSHVANVLGKLGAANRREAAAVAVRHRLV